MTDLCDWLLRPVLVFFFNTVYPRIPFHRKILWFFARGYFVDGKKACGEILDDLVVGKGYGALLNYCSEDAEDLAAILGHQSVYIAFIQEAAKRNDRENPLICLSIKMSQFGCFAQDVGIRRHGRDILEETIARAARAGVHIILDAERLTHAGETVLFALAMNRQHHNVGVRLQAYNPNFAQLVSRVVQERIYAFRERGRLPIGICKGAYDEERALSASKTRANFLRGLLYCYERHHPVAADTNDVALVKEILAATLHGVIPSAAPFSIGMLYNVRPWFGCKMRSAGIPVGLYLPVVRWDEKTLQGSHWEGFAIRRLTEKPLYIFLPFRGWYTKVLRRSSY